MEIGDYIARDNPTRALTFVQELEALARRVAANPGHFPARDDIEPGLRIAVLGRYKLICLERPDAVRIVRVLHSARDLRAALRG